MTKRSCSTASSVSSSSSSSAQHGRRLVPRHYVKHDYHDYANEPDDPAKTPIRRRKGGVNIPFPIVLHRVIAAVEADGLGHVFGWQPHGRAFLIHKPRQFVEHILPTYFKQNKLTSFQRQLNLYGFNRLTRGPDASGYYHEYFLKHREYLAKRMMRQRIKGTKIKGAASPDAEPDFYAMPMVTPTIDPHAARPMAPPASTSMVVARQEQDTPIVSCDDMSHDSSSLACDDDEGEEASLEEAPRQQQQQQQQQRVVAQDMEMVPSSSWSTAAVVHSDAYDTATTAVTVASSTTDEVPSMTDYTPMYSSVSSTDMMVASAVDETLGMPPAPTLPLVLDDDPADALLMDLHQMDPLEDFGWIMPKPTSQQEDEMTLQALEKDAALEQMLHQALDEFGSSMLAV